METSNSICNQIHDLIVAARNAPNRDVALATLARGTPLKL